MTANNPAPEPVVRDGARVVMVNDRTDVFLFRHQHRSGRNYWVLPGGGLEPGETWEQAALREMWEQTGVRGVNLGPWIWKRELPGRIEGQVVIARERYYLVRVPDDIVISTDHQLPHELAHYTESRWWSIEDLRETDDVVWPEGLAELLLPIRDGHLPEEPLRLLV